MADEGPHGTRDDPTGGGDWIARIAKQFAVSIQINVPGALIIGIALVAGMFVYYFLKPKPQPRTLPGYYRLNREEWRRPEGWPIGWPLGTPEHLRDLKPLPPPATTAPSMAPESSP